MTRVGYPDASRDQDAVVGVLSRFGRCLDTKDFDGYARCYTPDGVLVLPWGEARGPEVARFVRRDLGRFARTHHLTTNPLVEVSGDTALLEADVLAVHLHGGDPRDHWDVGGRYRIRCERTARGWLFGRVEVEVLWEGGRRAP
jgi:ketosteroid isomerase-like protein